MAGNHRAGLQDRRETAKPHVKVMDEIPGSHRCQESERVGVRSGQRGRGIALPLPRPSCAPLMPLSCPCRTRTRPPRRADGSRIARWWTGCSYLGAALHRHGRGEPR
jgi:hypothetical protein